MMDFDDLLVDNMASSMDVVIEAGDIETRVQELKVCVFTMLKGIRTFLAPTPSPPIPLLPNSGF